MLRLSVCLLFLSIISLPIYAQTYMRVNTGVQLYEQRGNIKSINLIDVNPEFNPVTYLNDVSTFRPLIGLSLSKITVEERLVKVNLEFAQQAYEYNLFTFVTDTEGDIVDTQILGAVGETESYFGSLAVDYGTPLLKKESNWQLYAAGRIALTSEFYDSAPYATTDFSTTYWFGGLSVALSPELNYTFGNDRFLIAFQPIAQFFKIGIDHEKIENPNQSEFQRTEGTLLEMFGQQPFGINLQFGWKI